MGFNSGFKGLSGGQWSATRPGDFSLRKKNCRYPRNVMPMCLKAGLVHMDATPQVEHRFLSRPAAAPLLLAETEVGYMKRL